METHVVYISVPITPESNENSPPRNRMKYLIGRPNISLYMHIWTTLRGQMMVEIILQTW